MARLKKNQKLALQRQWLNIWEAAGSPALNQTGHGIAPYSIKTHGFVQQTYGRASTLAIFLGDNDLTPLLATLGGLRLTNFNTLNMRSSAGHDFDKLTLAHYAFGIHLAAALAHRHIEAIRAIEPQIADQIEVESFVDALPAQVQGATLRPGGWL
jgi:hypothetical protein